MIKMAFIKEESEDERIEDGFGVKQEDAEVQTDLMILKEEKSEAEEEHHVLMTVEKSTKTEESSTQARPQTIDADSNFCCGQCGKRFSSKQKLDVHMSVHSGEEPCVCDQCGKLFTCKKNLKCHTCIHSVKNGFRCDHCGKCFKQKASAIRHLQTHVKEKSFTCTACGKSFSKHRNLDVHMRVHKEKTTESEWNGLVEMSQDSELATPAWQENVEDEMIRLVQERPALYDSMGKGYGNQLVKAQLWCEIENKLDLSSVYLRKKWDYLRAQFIKFKKLQHSGRFETLKTGRQQWILERLQFLKPHIKHLNVKESSSDSDSCSPLDGSAVDK